MRRFTVLGAKFGCFAVAGCVACTGHDLSDAPWAPSRTAQPIANGEPYAEEPGVVAVATLAADGRGAGLCTGTLILPNLVLTARHCVAPSPPGPVVCGSAEFGEVADASNVGVSPDTFLDRDSPWFAVERIYVPPDGNDVCGFDMALLLLRRSFAPEVVPPLEPRLGLPVFRGEPYTAVGYGVTAEDTPTAGLRRARDDLTILCPAPECGAAVADTEFAGQVGTCQGDSGGPALDEAGRVLGVLSRGGAECTTPVYGAVSRWAAWISGVAIVAAERGGFPAPEWVSADTADVEEPEIGVPRPSPPAPDPGDLDPVPTPQIAGAAEGEGCDDDGDCRPALACFLDGPPPGICAVACRSDAHCADSEVCDREQGACIDTLNHDDDSGCSIGASARAPREWLLSGLAVLLSFVRLSRGPRGRRTRRE